MNRSIRSLAALTTALLVAGGGASSLSASGNPRGANGTLKIDGIAFNQTPSNEPHVTCPFQLEYWGFDTGAVSTVTFEAQAPSGRGVIGRDTFTLQSDPAGGGKDFDGEKEYGPEDLDLSRLKAHPKQGYHVKVTVSVTGNVKPARKSKVFWIKDCTEQPPPCNPESTAWCPPDGGGDGGGGGGGGGGSWT